MYLGVVVNPFARKNRGMAADRSAALRRIVGPWGEVHETGSVDDLRGVVDAALSTGQPPRQRRR